MAERTRARSERASAKDSTPSGDALLPARRGAPFPITPYNDIPAPLAEAIRSIVNRYELRTGEPLPNSIGVTAAMPREGVTTVSQALATVIAQEIGMFVCWVDCSWLSANAKPVDDGRPDLLDLLADDSLLQSAFQTSPELPQLISLAPGALPEGKRNIVVRSPSFERLLAVLADEFDHVIFDLPPILTNAHALALLRRADASLVVVRHRTTTVGQVHRAIESTEPTTNLGVILNHYEPKIPARLRRLLRN